MRVDGCGLARRELWRSVRAAAAKSQRKRPYFFDTWQRPAMLAPSCRVGCRWSVGDDDHHIVNSTTPANSADYAASAAKLRPSRIARPTSASDLVEANGIAPRSRRRGREIDGERLDCSESRASHRLDRSAPLLRDRHLLPRPARPPQPPVVRHVHDDFPAAARTFAPWRRLICRDDPELEPDPTDSLLERALENLPKR